MAKEKLQSFFGGVMTGIKPDLLPPFASPNGQNAVIDRIAEQQGRVRRRKGAVARTCGPMTGSPQVLGIFYYPSSDAERILVIGDDGSLNVEGASEFVCPPPDITTVAVPSVMRFVATSAVASVPPPEAQETMASASKFVWVAPSQSAYVPGEAFCVGGIFGSQFNLGGVIEDYFPGTGHSHNLSDENTVEITNSVGVGGTYCVRTTTPGAPGGWVKWVAASPWESGTIGISADIAFHADNIAYISAPTDFIYTLPSEWAGGDMIIQIGPGVTEGTVRFWITFTDSADQYYSTGGDDITLVADTYYNIAVNLVYESSLGAADGSVQVLLDSVLVCDAQNVKLMSQLKKDSGGNNRIGGVYFSVTDRLDNVCITALN